MDTHCAFKGRVSSVHAMAREKSDFFAFLLNVCSSVIRNDDVCRMADAQFLQEMLIGTVKNILSTVELARLWLPNTDEMRGMDIN